MTNKLLTLIKMPLTMLFAIALMCQSTSLQAQQKNETSDVWTIELREETLVSLINPSVKTDKVGKLNWNLFIKEAFPMAYNRGWQSHGSLRIERTLIGNQNPGDFVLATWPDEDTDINFEKLPQWQQYKALRPIIWSKINYYKKPSGVQKQLVFHPDKTYTLALVWFDKACGVNTTACHELVFPELETVKSKHVHQLNLPRYYSITELGSGPSHIFITEWPSRDALDRYLQRTHIHQLREFSIKEVQKLEWYQITPKPSKAR